ncbi:MAG: hypothetical protein DMF35_00475, partial [Verrucomicrobia bacterium]
DDACYGGQPSQRKNAAGYECNGAAKAYNKVSVVNPSNYSSPRARLPEESRFSRAKIQGSDAPAGQVLRNQAERNFNSEAERV